MDQNEVNRQSEKIDQGHAHDSIATERNYHLHTGGGLHGMVDWVKGRCGSSALWVLAVTAIIAVVVLVLWGLFAADNAYDRRERRGSDRYGYAGDEKYNASQYVSKDTYYQTLVKEAFADGIQASDIKQMRRELDSIATYKVKGDAIERDRDDYGRGGYGRGGRRGDDDDRIIFIGTNGVPVVISR